MSEPPTAPVPICTGLPRGLPSLGRAILAYVAYFAAVGALFPYLPVYYDSIGLDLAAIGLLSAFSAAIQLVASPAWGALNDAFPRSRFPVPLAATVAAIGASALVVVRGDSAVAVAVLVLSVGIAGIGPILDTRTLDLLGPERARYGQVRAWGSASFVVSSWLTGLAIDRFGEPTLFAVYVPALVVTALIGLSLPARPVVRRQINVFRGALSIVRMPSMRVFFVGALFVWTMLGAMNTYYSIRIVTLGGANETVGLAWAIGAAVEVPMMFSFARLSGRFGTEPLLLLGGLLFAIRAAAAAFAGDATALVAIAPLEGMAFALFSVAAIGFVSARAPIGLAATAQGVYAALIGLASILGAALAGMVAGAIGVPGLFFLAALGSAVAAVLVWYGVQPGRSVAVPPSRAAFGSASEPGAVRTPAVSAASVGGVSTAVGAAGVPGLSTAVDAPGAAGPAGSADTVGAPGVSTAVDLAGEASSAGLGRGIDR